MRWKIQTLRMRIRTRGRRSPREDERDRDVIAETLSYLFDVNLERDEAKRLCSSRSDADADAESTSCSIKHGRRRHCTKVKPKKYPDFKSKGSFRGVGQQCQCPAHSPDCPIRSRSIISHFCIIQVLTETKLMEMVFGKHLSDGLSSLLISTGGGAYERYCPGVFRRPELHPSSSRELPVNSRPRCTSRTLGPPGRNPARDQTNSWMLLSVLSTERVKFDWTLTDVFPQVSSDHNPNPEVYMLKFYQSEV